jgi:hypothetical protein
MAQDTKLKAQGTRHKKGSRYKAHEGKKRK